MKFSELATKRLRAIRTDGGSTRTEQNYDEAYAMFVEFLHERGAKDDVREFSFENVEEFKGWLQARGNKASSINIRLAALSSLGKWGMQHGDGKGSRFLPANPVDQVSRPKKLRPREKFLYREEVAALFAVEAQPCERLVIAAFLDTGARVSEIATAKVKGLRPGPDGSIILSNTTKGGNEDAWPLGPEVSAALEATLREREVGPESPVFVNTQGNAYKRGTLIECVYRLAQRAGITRIPVRPHVLRHTYNTYGRIAGLDPVVRSRLLKHRDSSTVVKYDHLLPLEEIDARAKVREALRG
jgi:site-specific recombinase XerD